MCAKSTSLFLLLKITPGTPPYFIGSSSDTYCGKGDALFLTPDNATGLNQSENFALVIR